MSLLLLALGASVWVSPPSHQGVEMLVGPQADALAACHAAHTPDSIYATSLQFKAKRGRVRRVQIQEPTLAQPELERCMRKAARAWRVSETVDATLQWPLLLLPASAELLGVQPKVASAAESQFVAGLHGELQAQAQGLDDGVLVLGLEIQDTQIQGRPLRDTSADQTLGTALLPPLAWTSAPEGLELQGLRLAISGQDLPAGRAPRDREIQACLTQDKSTLNLVLLRGRVIASWGDACLADRALAWQMDPALTGALRWDLAAPAEGPKLQGELPIWRPGETGDLNAQLGQQMDYYRTRARSCFDAPGAVVVAVDVQRGQSLNPRVVDGQVPPKTEACLLSQSEAWTWPLEVQGERRIRLAGP